MAEESQRCCARQKAAMYDHWVLKHREEIDMHRLTVEREYADEKRIRKERVATRRSNMLEVMRQKRDMSHSGALERHEPFPMGRETDRHRMAFIARQRDRAWAQPLVFLPPAVAARDKTLKKERSLPGYFDEVQQVYDLQ